MQARRHSIDLTNHPTHRFSLLLLTLSGRANPIILGQVKCVPLFPHRHPMTFMVAPRNEPYLVATIFRFLGLPLFLSVVFQQPPQSDQTLLRTGNSHFLCLCHGSGEVGVKDKKTKKKKTAQEIRDHRVRISGRPFSCILRDTPEDNN